MAATSVKTPSGCGHRVVTVSDGASATVGAPVEPSPGLTRVIALPHAVGVERICVSSKAPRVAYTTGSDCRVCCTGLGAGRPRAQFGESGAVRTEAWQLDLALVGEGAAAALCGAGTSGAAREREMVRDTFLRECVGGGGGGFLSQRDFGDSQRAGGA